LSFAIAGSGIEPNVVQSFKEAATRWGYYGTIEAMALRGMMKL